MCYSSMDMIDKPGYTEGDLDEFAAYVAEVLQCMTNNRDIIADEYGMPVFAVDGEHLSDSRMKIDLLADMSAIGMPMDTPFSAVRIREHPERITWLLDDAMVITTTPVDWTPKQVADEALEMNNLLDAHRKWVARSFGGRER